MGIIGKVYANSMLVLINSRMVLGSKEAQTPPTVMSVLRFGTAPADPEDSDMEADNGDVAEALEREEQGIWVFYGVRSHSHAVKIGARAVINVSFN